MLLTRGKGKLQIVLCASVYFLDGAFHTQVFEPHLDQDREAAHLRTG